MKTICNIFASIVVITLSSMLITSCGGGKSGKNVIVLLDISTSIKQDVLDWYIQTIEKDICANLSQFDRITIRPIDGASQTASKALLQLDLFQYRNEWRVMGLNSNETSQLKKEAFAKFIHTKMVEFKETLTEAREHRQKVGNATDILGALEVAQNDFGPDEDNLIIIIIMSDMEQYADKCKMTGKGKAADWLMQINEVKLPNLQQFSVAIVTGEQMAMSKAYYNEIQTFWNEFFAQQGVKTLQYSGASVAQLKSQFFKN